MVVYNENNNEVAVNLGSLSTDYTAVISRYDDGSIVLNPGEEEENKPKFMPWLPLLLEGE